MPKFNGLWMIVVGWFTSPVIIWEIPRFQCDFGVTIHCDLKTELDAVRDQLFDMKRLLKCKDDERWATCLLQAEKGVSCLAHRDAQVQDQKAKALERQKNGNQSASSTIAMPSLPSGDFGKWEPEPNWVNNSFADINIVGLRKAGTSHLYRIIASHPEVERFAVRKELCMPKNASLEVMFNFCKRFVRDHRKKTVNGCFRSDEVSRWWFYLRQPRTKVIFIFRDPAAWLWAAFNFWFIEGFDAPPSPQPNWAGSNQYRTAEMFHEGIVSGSRTGLGLFLNEFRYKSVVNPRQWIAMLGRNNLLFVKSEDMSLADPSRQGSLMDQISAFIGLTQDGFNKSIMGARTNCGDMKGDTKECNASSGTYQISGKREMLPHTKDIIYLQFLEECNIWSQEFDVHYPACLEIPNRSG